MTKYEKKMILTDDDKREYEESTHCHICGKEFSETDRKVKDHYTISPGNSEVLLTTHVI